MTSTMPLKPIKPTLQPIGNSSGGVCFDKADSVKLGRYILDLESGYD